MKKLNNYLKIGLLINAMISLLRTVFELPEFIIGVGMGLGITFLLIGMYAINHDMTKLKIIKANFYKKCFNRKG